MRRILLRMCTTSIQLNMNFNIHPIYIITSCTFGSDYTWNSRADRRERCHFTAFWFAKLLRICQVSLASGVSIFSSKHRVTIVFSLAITAFTSLSLHDLRVIVWLLSLTALLENTFLSHSSAEDWIRFCSRISSYYNAIIVVIMTPVEMVPFRHPFNINSTLIVWKFNVVPSDQCLSLPQVPQAWFSPKEI